MKIKIGYFPAGPHPWRPRRPFRKVRVVCFGLIMMGETSGFVGALGYDVGNHRFHFLQWAGVSALVAALVIYFRYELKRQLGRRTEP